jgi:hypothetical protein
MSEPERKSHFLSRLGTPMAIAGQPPVRWQVGTAS